MSNAAGVDGSAPEWGDYFEQCPKFQRDVYLYYGKHGMKVSPDGQKWAPIHDLRTIKKLFGHTRKGSLSVGFGVTRQDGMVVSVGVRQP